MQSILNDFFLLSGLSDTPPETMSALIPYLINIFVGVSMVSGVFAMFGKMIDILFSYFRIR